MMSRNEPLGALINLQMGFLRSACPDVVAKLQVADQLTDGERTVEEYRKLLEAAGFRYSGVTPTNSIVSVVEGIYFG
jgi:hypothetical protein